MIDIQIKTLFINIKKPLVSKVKKYINKILALSISKKNIYREEAPNAIPKHTIVMAQETPKTPAVRTFSKSNPGVFAIKNTFIPEAIAQKRAVIKQTFEKFLSFFAELLSTLSKGKLLNATFIVISTLFAQDYFITNL